MSFRFTSDVIKTSTQKQYTQNNACFDCRTVMVNKVKQACTIYGGSEFS